MNCDIKLCFQSEYQHNVHQGKNGSCTVVTISFRNYDIESFSKHERDNMEPDKLAVKPLVQLFSLLLFFSGGRGLMGAKSLLAHTAIGELSIVLRRTRRS